MAYKMKKWRFPHSNEYEFTWAGNYGARGERRAERRKATSEEVEKINQRNREKKLRRLIKANFEAGDYWVTLLYPKGTRKPTEEVKEDLKRFLQKLRREYKAAGEELKFIYRIEIGTRGGIHAHILCNRIRNGDVIIQKHWIHGRASFEHLREDINSLAEYIAKKMNDAAAEQMESFEPDKKKNVTAYHTSRNLIRPEPEVKEMKRRTMTRMIVEGPKATKGYVVDKSSIITGINPFTGMSYMHYTEVRHGTG